MDCQMKPRIAIIGSGISGLAAAQQLVKLGLNDVVVFEAMGRIGGRIWTKYLSDEKAETSHRLEIGAQWIHGTCSDNPVFNIAKAHKLLNKPDNLPKFRRYETIYRTTDGDIISTKLFKEISTWYAKTIDECDRINYEIKKNKDKIYEKDEGVESYIRRKFESFLTDVEMQKKKPDVDMCRRIFNHKLMYETSLSACDSVDELSLQQFGSYVTLDAGDCEIHHGFTKVLDTMVADLPENSIRLNSPVKKVMYRTLEHDDTENESLSNTIELDDGTIELFDHVIVTSSLWYLKQNHANMFRPPLSNSKQASISALGIGTVDKIFLQFDNLEFLDENTRSIFFCWPLEVDLSNWVTRMFSVSVCNQPKQDTLMFWITGSGAEEMETLPEDHVIEECLQLLKSMLKNDSIPRPRRLIRSCWHSNPYIGGSYTHIPVGATVDDITELSKPLCCGDKPVVLFAGEATHPEFYSTTHGALLSGQKEASRIHKYYNPPHSTTDASCCKCH